MLRFRMVLKMMKLMRSVDYWSYTVRMQWMPIVHQVYNRWISWHLSPAPHHYFLSDISFCIYFIVLFIFNRKN